MLPVKLRRLFMAQHKVDFRKQLDGLLGEAYRLGANPYDGDCVVFIKRDRGQLRAIVGDGVGLYLVSRRFDGGRIGGLPSFVDDPAATEISAAELSLLLEGATYTVHRRARPWRSSRKVRQPAE
jgi:hypothetical protein